MTIETRQPVRSSLGHAFKRIFLTLFGYLVSVLIGLVAIVVIYSVASHLPNAPDYFKSMSMAPIALLLVPPLWFFYFFVAVTATVVPALVVVLACEFLSLRGIWLNMLSGGAVALIGYAMLSSETYVAGVQQTLADFGVVAGAGLVGGFVYWLIAGRDAGFRQRA